MPKANVHRFSRMTTFDENFKKVESEIISRFAKLGIEVHYSGRNENSRVGVFTYRNEKLIQAFLIIGRYRKYKNYDTEFVDAAISAHYLVDFKKRVYKPNDEGILNIDSIIKGFYAAIGAVHRAVDKEKSKIDEKQKKLDKEIKSEDEKQKEIGYLPNHAKAKRDPDTGLYSIQLENLNVDQIRQILLIAENKS